MLRYREIEIEDAWKLVELRTDPDTYVYLKDASWHSVKKTEEWIKTLGGSSRRIIVETEDNKEGYYTKTVGVIRIDNIDKDNRNLCLGLDITPQYRGQGLSKDIYNWALDYFFNKLNFHLIWLEVLEDNVRAVNLYKKMGFKVDGVLRDRVYRDGYKNYLSMSILREEFNDNRSNQPS